MLPVAAQRHQRRGKAERERRLGQLQPDGAADEKSGERRDGRRPCHSGPSFSAFALHDQDRDARQDEDAHRVVVIGRAEHVEAEAAGLAEQRQRRGAQLVFLDAQRLAAEDVERHDVGALHAAEREQREPGRRVRRQQVERDVLERIVVGGLVRDEHVDALAPVQERVRDVPMVIAEIPGRVLAQPQDVAAPEGDRDAEEQPFLDAELERARVEHCLRTWRWGTRARETDDGSSRSLALSDKSGFLRLFDHQIAQKLLGGGAGRPRQREGAGFGA